MTEPEQEDEGLDVRRARRRRHRVLSEWLDELDRKHGPVPEALIVHYETLFAS